MTGFLRRLCMLVLCALLPACGVGDFIGDIGSNEKIDLPAGETMGGQENAAAFEVLNRVNAVRTSAGLSPLTWDGAAADAAYDHAVDMRVRGYYDHSSPEGDGPCSRLRSAGVDPFACGSENIARGEDTPEEVVAVWMGSPSHRETLLSPYATHVGVGVSMGGSGPWWVMDLYSPNQGQ